MSALDSPSFKVTPMLDALGRFAARYPRLLVRMGNAESTLLVLDEEAAIAAPVYVCGLARSGSTMLLEILASHPDVATHRYGDFPFVFTPYVWNRLRALNPLRDTKRRERAHGDGIWVNADSPEAMEEMLWMAFFPDSHSGEKSHVLDSLTAQPGFERFYRAHIQKLLLARKAKRYVSKGNYNIIRLAYLHRLFPDARFIIPIREPAAHIESLMRQHARFSEAGRKDARIARHMSMAGHFEFGLNRIPIHTGDDRRISEIHAAWSEGDELRGWALYWDMIYRFVHEQLQTYPVLKERVMLLRYEQLCQAPRETIEALCAHSLLPNGEATANQWAGKIHAPDYYQSALSEPDRLLIKKITGETAKLFGY